AGMWEFPGVVRRPDESAADAAARAALETAGVRVRVEERLGVVKHAFTHVRAVYEAFRASPVGASGSLAGTREAALVAREELMAYAMPRAQRKLAELLFRQD